MTELLTSFAEKKQVLQEKLIACGFEGMEAFLEKRMEPAELQKLQQEIGQLETNLTTVQSALAERQKMLNENLAKLSEGSDRQKNLDILEEQKDKLNCLNAELQELEFTLRQDKENKTRSQQILKDLEGLRKLSENWASVDKYFGGPNGKNFENIAQVHTFKGLLHCAGCQIQTRGGVSMPLTRGALAAARHIVGGNPKKLFSFALDARSMKTLGDMTEAFLMTQQERGYRTLDYYKSLHR